MENNIDCRKFRLYISKKIKTISPPTRGYLFKFKKHFFFHLRKLCKSCLYYDEFFLASLRFNLHRIKYTHLKCIVWWVLVIMYDCKTTTTIFILLCFALLLFTYNCFFFFFQQIESLWQLCIKQVFWTFATVFAPFELQFSSFPDICPGVGLLDHMATLFNFLRNLHIVFHNDCAAVTSWCESS